MAEVNSNINLPKFLFVGTAKAGTTSVFRYLKQHPQINIPMKETFFFMRDVYANITHSYPFQRSDEPLFRNDEAYFDLYKNQAGITGEIGTGYLYYYKQAGPLIKQYLGDDVKILILLRNPVDRCFSSYKHFAKDLFERDPFEDALRLEDQRIQDQWDFMWHYKALGMYYEQVKYYMDNFKHVKVVLYDDFMKNPTQTMQDIIKFIGVDTPFEFKTEAVFNESGTPKSEWLHKLIVHDHGLKRHITRPILKALLPYAWRDKIRKTIRNQNFKKSELKINPETQQMLKDYYRNDIQQLAKLINRDLSAWL